MGIRGTNLIRRNGTYYFRSRVPKTFQASIGKKEIILSLRTCDYGEARLLATTLRTRLLTMLMGDRMDEKEARKKERKRRIRARKMRAPNFLPIGKDSIYPVPDSMKIHMDDEFEVGVRAQDLVEGWAKESESHKQTAQQNEQDANDAQKALVKATLAGSAPIAPQASPPAPDLHPDADKPFHGFMDDYIANRSEGDKQEHRTAFKQMREVLGDMPIKDITKNDIISCVDFMKATKGKKGNATVSYKTINKKLSCMKGFFRMMKGDKNLIAINPVEGITSGASKHEREEAQDNKRPFTKAELKKIFHSPLFTGCKSLERVYDKGDVLCRNHKFWLSILGFFSGARISEIWQLEFSDIVKKDGGWFIHISRTSEYGHKKYTKNIPSIRYVPLHPELKKIGLWDYLAERKKKSKDGRIFPKYRYGNMFNQELLRKKLKIVDYEVSFHCLRHCFKDACVEADIPESLISRLMGHEVGTITGKYGSKDLFKKQTEMMNRIKFLIPMNHLFK